ncbi:MAG TPA: hypothetical protein VG326_01620 [Tepidisphaeraceae bacterium]|jgi:hypothetical protein|nr:hypothetical protein [Tepidisphaeraceae bacterium]
MTNSPHDESLGVLEELHSACPELRLGQLIVNLSYLARGPAVESVWDVEDSELLQATKTQLENLRSPHMPVA